MRNGEDFFCYLVLNLFCSIAKISYLCVWLIHKIYFCIFICSSCCETRRIFFYLKANLSDKYLDMSDIIATFVA